MKNIFMAIVLGLSLATLTSCGHSHVKGEKGCADCAKASGCTECAGKTASSGCPDCKTEAKK